MKVIEAKTGTLVKLNRDHLSPDVERIAAGTLGVILAHRISDSQLLMWMDVENGDWDHIRVCTANELDFVDAPFYSKRDLVGRCIKHKAAKRVLREFKASRGA